MVYAVIGEIGFKNAARRDNTATNIRNRLAPGGMYGQPTVENRTGVGMGSTDPAIYVEVRFLLAADRDSFYTDVLALLTGANGPVVGSRLSKHDCTHDEPVPQPCVISESRTF